MKKKKNKENERKQWENQRNTVFGFCRRLQFADVAPRELRIHQGRLAMEGGPAVLDWPIQRLPGVRRPSAPPQLFVI
jgi:NAD-dependent DNA ligase